MAQSIRHRRGIAARQGSAREQLRPDITQSQRESAVGRFEAVVPYYHSRVLEALDSEQAAKMDQAELAEAIGSLLRRLEVAPEAPPIGGQPRQPVTRLVDEMRGLGPLGPLLRDPDISDILVNGLNSVYIERGGRLSHVDIRFRDATT